MQKLFIFVLISLSFSTFAQEASNNKIAYISDDLFIYFHSGPGTQYRILGSINAGEEVQLIGAVANDYQQIQDVEGRKGWLDAKYLSNSPGLRVVVAELNEELADKTVQVGLLKTQLNDVNKQLSQLQQQASTLTKQNTSLTKQYNAVAVQLDERELNIKLTYFSYGAVVLIIGLIFGLILPRIPRRKSNYSSWN